MADRDAVLRDWHRLLKLGGRLLYTDPIIVTGPLSSEEVARRSSIGFFLFVPSGYNERLLESAGFHLIDVQDSTENTSRVTAKWFESRECHREGLISLEGRERFEGLQAFFATVSVHSHVAESGLCLKRSGAVSALTRKTRLLHCAIFAGTR